MLFCLGSKLLCLAKHLYQYCSQPVRAQCAQYSNVLSLCLDCRMLEENVLRAQKHHPKHLRGKHLTKFCQA